MKNQRLRDKMWFIVMWFVLFFPLGIYFLITRDKTRIKKFKIKPKASLIGNYKGGYANIPFKINDCNIETFEDYLAIRRPFAKEAVHKISLGDIKNITIKTEQEIQKDVTLTRLAVFGLFAFGMKKKKVNTSRYLIIETSEDGFDDILVIEVEGNTFSSFFVKQTREEITKYRNKASENI